VQVSQVAFAERVHIQVLQLVLLQRRTLRGAQTLHDRGTRGACTCLLRHVTMYYNFRCLLALLAARAQRLEDSRLLQDSSGEDVDDALAAVLAFRQAKKNP